MSTRWPREVFGVQIIYIRDYIARKAVAIVPGGSSVWALLPDGRVGCNDADFFRRWYGKGSKSEVQVAEKLWRLGKLKKSVYEKLAKAHEQKQTKSHKKSVASDLKHYAREIGLTLSKEQDRYLEKLSI